MTDEEKYKLELVHKRDMGNKKRFFKDGFGEIENLYPVRNNLKEFVDRLPKDEEVVGIVYDESFTLEILTAKKEIR